MSLGICAPASTIIGKEFNSNNNILLVLYITVPNLGQAFSSLYISPLSERFGRVPIYHIFSCFYILLTLATGFSSSLDMLIVFRVLTGCVIAPICLNPAITGDMFAATKRGSAMSIASMIPILGSAIGPIIGGYITQYLGWRWTFWIMATLTAAIQPIIIGVLKESYVPIIRKRALLKASIDVEKVPSPSKYLLGWNLKSVKAISLLAVRPFIILGSSRVAVLMALYLSVLYAYLGLLAANMATVYQQVYGFSESQSGLVYMATSK